MTRSRVDHSNPIDEGRKARSRMASIGGASLKILREAPATLLTGASAILYGGSKLAEMGARKLSPPPAQPNTVDLAPPQAPGPAPATEATESEVDAGGGEAPPPMIDADAPAATGGEAPADIGEPTTAAPGPLDEQGRARTYESHIAELADRNAAGVVRQIPDLSTEELGQLFEYESARRKRKTVLQAIERASRPGGQAGR